MMEIILCIPGRWKDRSEFVMAVAGANLNEYIFAGNILLHLPTKESFEIDFQQRDEELQLSFQAAGQGRLTETELNKIGHHTFIAYLIGKGGDQAGAARVMIAAGAILNAGGLGVKVETSGKAFSASQWTEISSDEEASKFFDAFILLLREETGAIYSCGLHNIGLRDIICDPALEIDAAIDLIRIFIFYQLYDKPAIQSGQTFSKDADAPVFRIIEETCKTYDRDDLFFNPFGMYYLQALRN